MRISIDGRYIRDHFPGIGRYTYHLIEALAPLCSHDTLIVLHNPALLNTRYDLSALARHPNVELHQIDMPTFSIAEQIVLPWIARRLSLDLLHSPYYIKPYWLPCPSVVTVYDLIPARYPQSLPSPWARLAFKVTTRLALASARQVITLSQASQQDLSELYGVPETRTRVTYLAADERFRPQGAERVTAVRRTYHLPEKYVLYLGINKPHKNLVRLIDAFSRLTFDVSRFTLVIAGHWDQRYPEVKRRVEELDLQDRVIFLGPVPEADLPALYSGATLFVFPSLYEGFGLPVLEAMACGVPVICSNTSSLPEVAGDAAIMVNPLDVDELAAAMERVLEDPALREEMAGKGTMQASKFSWERTARETLGVYESVVRSR
ncbi:MAG TPA: glycosyltransferase family 1 protein [Anaerolineae bacterium]|nr:glycosyltransferase family 1 protein [Anaerolineae bacterium]